MDGGRATSGAGGITRAPSLNAHAQSPIEKKRKTTPNVLSSMRKSLGGLSEIDLDYRLSVKDKERQSAHQDQARKETALEYAKQTVQDLERDLQNAKKTVQDCAKDLEDAEAYHGALQKTVWSLRAVLQAKEDMKLEAKKKDLVKTCEEELRRLKEEEATSKAAAERRLGDLDGIDLEVLFAEPGQTSMGSQDLHSGQQQHYRDQQELEEEEQTGSMLPELEPETDSSLSQLNSEMFEVNREMIDINSANA